MRYLRERRLRQRPSRPCLHRRHRPLRPAGRRGPAHGAGVEIPRDGDTTPARPCVSILGGAKVSDKIEVIQNLGKIVDSLLIGGAMAYTFLRAQGLPTGRSLVEADKIDLAGRLISELGSKLLLPVDHVVVREIAAGAPYEVVETIPDDRIAVDIGPKTIERYSQVIAAAKTIIWNG